MLHPWHSGVPQHVVLNYFLGWRHSQREQHTFKENELELKSVFRCFSRFYCTTKTHTVLFVLLQCTVHCTCHVFQKLPRTTRHATHATHRSRPRDGPTEAVICTVGPRPETAPLGTEAEGGGGRVSWAFDPFVPLWVIYSVIYIYIYIQVIDHKKHPRPLQISSKLQIRGLFLQSLMVLTTGIR